MIDGSENNSRAKTYGASKRQRFSSLPLEEEGWGGGGIICSAATGDLPLLRKYLGDAD